MEGFNHFNEMKTIKQIFEIRITNAVLLLIVLPVLALLFASVLQPHNHRGSDRAACILNQRNIQQAVRGHASIHSQNIGDSIDWSKIIGDGQYLERVPECPVHGKDSYDYSKTIPPVGVLVAPCKDIAHKPVNIQNW